MFPIRDTRTTGQTPIITILLILVNIWVFLQELISPNLDQFINTYALIPAQVNFFNYQTLAPFITFQFLHAGFLHIASNMWFLWVFGPNLEAVLGKMKFLLFYLLAGIFSGLIQFFFLASTNPAIPMLGASGAIAGVLGAYLKLFSNHRIETMLLIFFLPFFIALPAGLMLIYWFFTQLFNGVASIYEGTAAVGGVAWWAHVGGFTFGWLLIDNFGPIRKKLFLSR